MLYPPGLRSGQSFWSGQDKLQAGGLASHDCLHIVSCLACMYGVCVHYSTTACYGCHMSVVSTDTVYVMQGPASVALPNYNACFLLWHDTLTEVVHDLLSEALLCAQYCFFALNFQQPFSFVI